MLRTLSAAIAQDKGAATRRVIVTSEKMLRIGFRQICCFFSLTSSIEVPYVTSFGRATIVSQEIDYNGIRTSVFIYLGRMEEIYDGNQFLKNCRSGSPA